MLTQYYTYADDHFDYVHNYYERVVFQEIVQQSQRVRNGDRDFLADVACVTLNRLPPRYIRHDVDMTFFMSPQDMQEIEDKVTKAVSEAIHYVESREKGEDVTLATVDVKLVGNRASKPTKNESAVKAETSKQSKKK